MTITKQKTILEQTDLILEQRNKNSEEPPKEIKPSPKKNGIKWLVIGALSVLILICIGLVSVNQQLSSQNNALKKQIEQLQQEVKQAQDALETFKEEYQTSLTQTKNVYLTFDDGPSTQTSAILDILKQYNVKATFFVLGGKDHALYQRIVNEGHQIAIHTYTHQYQDIYASVDAYFKDMYALADELQHVTGVRPQVFRFPGGSSNTIGSQEVIEGIIKRSKEEGLVYFDWNCDSQDASKRDVTSEHIATQSKYCIGKQNVVLLMHDSETKGQTKEALPSIIEAYQNEQYVFRRLNVLSPLVQHKQME